MSQLTLFLGFDHVQLAMPRGQEDAARAFWTGLLGFVELQKFTRGAEAASTSAPVAYAPPRFGDEPADLAVRGGAWFAFPGGQVHVGVEEPFIPARKAHPAFRLRSADACRALHAHLEAAGVPVRWAHEDPAVVRFHADDPFGNRLEFTCPL